MRAKILQMTPEFFVQVVCKGPTPGTAFYLSKNPLPDDATIESVEVGAKHNEFRIVLSSRSWPEAGDGPFPVIYPHPQFSTCPQPGWSDPNRDRS